MIRALRSHSGFSLVELALILAIVGFLGASVLETYRGYIRTKIANDTGLHKNIVTQALVNFVTNYGRLPCPADPTLPPGVANAGLEQCTAGGGLLQVDGHRKTSSAPSWIGWQSNSALPGYGDPLPSVPLNGDPVLLGSIPYITLGVSVRDTLDGWNNRFTYAVSKYMTDASKFNYDNGVIDILQLQRTETPPGSGTFTEAINPIVNKVSVCPALTHPTCNPPNPAPPIVGRRGAFLYVILSHGRDGKGAYSYYGARSVACASAPGRDQENCDDDRTFVDADPKTNIYTLVHTLPAATDVYFDDPFMAYSLARSSDKWAYQTTTSMYNKTKANVGIGVKVPTTMLDVGGNVRAGNYLANQFCSLPWDNPATPVNPDKPSFCINARMIDGPDGSVYGTGRALGCPEALMRGIANGAADCEVAVDLTTVTSGTCTPGSYVKGISSTGSIICATP